MGDARRYKGIQGDCTHAHPIEELELCDGSLREEFGDVRRDERLPRLVRIGRDLVVLDHWRPAVARAENADEVVRVDEHREANAHRLARLDLGVGDVKGVARSVRGRWGVEEGTRGVYIREAAAPECR